MLEFDYLKDIACESLEQNIKTIRGLKTLMIKSGIDESDATYFIEALRSVGIYKMVQLKNISIQQQYDLLTILNLKFHHKGTKMTKQKVKFIKVQIKECENGLYNK